MVFSSFEFLLIFMPIFFGVYYIVPLKLKNIILLLGSLSFYLVGTWEAPEHFAVFILSMLLDYLMGVLMEKKEKHKKLFLSLGIVFHLLALGFFKYFTFLSGELEKLFPMFHIDLKILLPIGISFYTFQGISYLIDVYRKSVKAEKNVIDFCVYISMFPQLIAGPIVKYSQVEENLKSRKITLHSVLSGLGTFIFGLGLKVLLANPIYVLWKDILTTGFESISTPLAWLGIIAYSFHIYFDFFGYSLMAIGLGKMLGFHFPKNFNFPYLSYSVTEFWRRWHMTLSSWFKEYVYIPLGGNRKGPWRTVLNLLLVWLLTGIWHGAGYNFVLWGLVTFLFIVAEKFLYGNFLSKHRFIGHLYMMVLIPLMWAIFAVDDIGELGVLFTRLFPFFGTGPSSFFKYDYLKAFVFHYPMLLACTIFSTYLPFNLLKKIKHKWILVVFLSVILGLSLYCIYMGFNDPFLYFRF